MAHLTRERLEREHNVRVIDLADATDSDNERPADMSEVGIGDLLTPRLALPRDVPKWIAEGQKLDTIRVGLRDDGQFLYSPASKALQSESVSAAGVS